MSDDSTRLLIVLEAQNRRLQNQLTQSNRLIDRFAAQTEKRFLAMNKKIEGGFGGLFVGLRAVASAALVQTSRQLIDTSTRIANSLKVAGLEGENLKQVYDGLFQSAQRNAAPIESLAELYSRASLSAGDLGASQEQLLSFVDKVSVALRVNGKSVQESSGALLQLSQLLGSGTVRAEEFNSVQEGALPILQAVANGLEDAGGSVSKLRALVIQGKVSSQAFFDAFNAGSDILNDKVAGAELTTSQAFVRLSNVLIDVAGQFNENTNASRLLVEGIDNLGTGVQDLATFLNNIAVPLQAFVANLQSPIDKVNELANGIARITGLDRVGFNAATAVNNLGVGPALEVHSSVAGRVVDETFSLLGETPQDTALADILTGKKAPAPAEVPVTPVADTDAPRRGGKVSLSDYPVPTKSGKGGSGSKKNDYEREIESITKRTDALNAETAAQAGLNPLVNDFGYAVAKAQAQQELLTAAQEAGIQITPAIRANIDLLAEGYAQATAQAGQLEKAQDRAREKAELFADTAKSSLSGFISDLRQGKSAAEALGNALANIGDKLLDFALGSLFDTDKGNILGNIFGALGFAKGGIARNGRSMPLPMMATGGVSRTPAIISEYGQPEAAVPLPDGRRIPVDLRAPNTSAKPMALTVNVSLDNELLHATVTDEAGRVVAKASPAIVGASVSRANKAAPGAVAQYQAQRAGSDWRLR